MINLTCPNCETELELDEGFRGSVCRCFNCKTLITVPHDPDGEVVSGVAGEGRPSRPGDSGLLDPDDPVLERIDGDSERERPAVRRRTKKEANMAAMWIMVVSTLVAIGGVGGLAYYWFGPNSSEKKEPEVNKPEVETAGELANPFTLGKANVFGIEIGDGEKVVVTFDGTRSEGRHRYLYMALAAYGLGTLESGQSGQVIAWNENEAVLVPKAMTAGGGMKASEIEKTLVDVDWEGKGDVSKAMAAIEKSGANVVVYVGTDMPFGTELTKTVEVLKKTKAKVVVIHVNGQVEHKEMQKLVDESGGEYHMIQAEHWARWKEKAGV